MTPRLPLPIQPQSNHPPPSPQVKREALDDVHRQHRLVKREDMDDREDPSLKRRRLESGAPHSPVPRPSSAHTQLSPNGQPPSPYHYPYSHPPSSHAQHPAQLHPPPPPHDYHYTHGPPISPNMTQPAQPMHGAPPPPPPPPQTLIYPHQQYFPYGVGDMRYPTPPQPLQHQALPMGPPQHLQHHHIPPPMLGHQMQLGVAVPGPSFALRRPIPARQRTSIACRYCRRRKIRCSGFDPENPDSRCSNCIRFNQECVFIPVSSMASTDKKTEGSAEPAGYERLSPTLSDSDKREWKPQPHPTSPTEIRNAISPPPTASASRSPSSASAPTRSKLSIQNLLG
ncbi:hypothetical protein CJU89_2460 [Yarrowia sp. B02]|nr:hypothetical protein CJU89_2460 [Yarrowia sp. B02]